MPTVAIVANVVNLTILVPKPIKSLTIDMSLQRHHYRYCATGGSQPINSMMYSTITDAQVIVDVTDLGKQLESLSTKINFKPEQWFGKTFTVPSQRVYLVDNTGLMPNGYPNHFFVTDGSSVWSQMNQNEWLAAQAICRVEEAISSKASDKINYLEGKTIAKMINDPNFRDNPVIQRYREASGRVRIAANDEMLKQCSNQPKIVQIAQNL